MIPVHTEHTVPTGNHKAIIQQELVSYSLKVYAHRQWCQQYRSGIDTSTFYLWKKDFLLPKNKQQKL